tara:strand:+ start:1298 stop:1708 length:411 start_codon:yes stop_codon:yes gene_type:complete
MTAASNYLEDTLLKHIMASAGTNGADYDTSSLAFFVSLHTGSPGEANDGANEITGNAYARQSATFGNVTSGSVSTNATISFPQASGNYSANVTHIGIFDAASGGNLLFYGALSSAKTVTDGDVFQINSGSLTITLA